MRGYLKCLASHARGCLKALILKEPYNPVKDLIHEGVCEISSQAVKLEGHGFIVPAALITNVPVKGEDD